MAKKSRKISIASLLVMLFAVVAIVAFFVPSMTLAESESVSGLDMTMEMFEKTTLLDIAKDTDLMARFSWSTLINLGDNEAAASAMEVLSFVSLISAGIMFVLGLLGVISKKKNKLLNLLTLIFCVATLISGISGLVCGIVLQSAFSTEILGETITAISLSAGTIMTAAAGLLGTLSYLVFKRK